MLGVVWITKELNAAKRQMVAEYIEEHGLPQPFARLKVLGLHKVVTDKEIGQKNKEIIFKFLNHISPEVSELRLSFYAHKLRKLAGWLKKDFDEVTEDDIRSLVTYLTKDQEQKYSKSTLHGYKVTLKRFYRWLEGDDEEYPKKVKWIKSSGDIVRIKEPEELLTPDEFMDLLRCAKTPRDKAMISFLYESGARVSEMLSMKIRHLVFSENIMKATLPVSKTRPRIIPLVNCRGHLATWINYHPLKNDPEAHLWTNFKQDGRRHLKPQTVGDIVRAVAKSAGIRKRVFPHLFRACSITNKQKDGWPEQAIKSFHGLSKDSKVMKHYSHLSYNNLEDIQKKMHGFPVEERTELNMGVKCPSCGRRNPLYNDVCECGLPTEMKFVPKKTTLSEEEIEKRVERKVQKLIESRESHDKVMERFLAALLEKSKRSPELSKVIGEIANSMKRQDK